MTKNKSKKLLSTALSLVLTGSLLGSCGRYDHSLSPSVSSLTSRNSKVSTSSTRNKRSLRASSRTRRSTSVTTRRRASTYRGFGATTKPGQIIVRFRQQMNTQLLRSFSQRYRVKILKGSNVMGTVLVQNYAQTETNQLIQYLKQDPSVEYAEPNHIMRNNFTVNDPNTAKQKGLARIGAAKAWDVTLGDPRVVIAVVDTGVDMNHPDLKTKLVPGYNVISQGQTPPQDDNGHGTHASGIAAAATDNKVGIAGTAPNCKLMPIKALDAEGGGGVMDVALGILWAVDHGAHIVNLSLGGPDNSVTVERAIKYALRKDVAVVVAMGNESTDEARYPAASPGVIAVGSVDWERNLSDFSNRGQWTSVVAPGTQIFSTMPVSSSFMTDVEGFQSGYDFMDGTSMAAPMVAGVVALMKSRHPRLRPAEIKARLEATAIDLGQPGFDTAYGHGMVNAYRAVL